MTKATSIERDPLYVVAPSIVTKKTKAVGYFLVWGTFVFMFVIGLIQLLYTYEKIFFGFETWRPLLYAYILWACAIGYSRVLIYGERGKRALFIFPALMFIISIVIFPMLFGLYISFTDWNLSSIEGRKFNGLDNFYQMISDPYYWNALKNMIFYVLAVLVEFAIAFLLALLLNSQIRARKFFRITFLIPLMLSPVAVSWMVGKSMLEQRFGPIANLGRFLGWETPTFFSSPEIARLTMMCMDAWTFIPLMIIMLLAGLQALPKEVLEAAKVDGANKWTMFKKIIFPIMLPVSLTTLVIRIIFKLKLADIIIIVTAGGPGGATDSVTSFIYREYRDRSNVGYGTLLSFVYLILIIIFMTILIRVVNKWLQREA
jgi:multiple sugar transport system permease protein